MQKTTEGKIFSAGDFHFFPPGNSQGGNRFDLLSGPVDPPTGAQQPPAGRALRVAHSYPALLCVEWLILTLSTDSPPDSHSRSYYVWSQTRDYAGINSIYTVSSTVRPVDQVRRLHVLTCKWASKCCKRATWRMDCEESWRTRCSVPSARREVLRLDGLA